MATQQMSDFTQKLTQLRRTRTPPTTRTPTEIVDDEVTIGEGTKDWDREEHNGRVYLTRR